MHSIKINRALKLSTIGDCGGSADDMLRMIPAATVARLRSRELAELLDAMWTACSASKAIAAREIIDEGPFGMPVMSVLSGWQTDSAGLPGDD